MVGNDAVPEVDPHVGVEAVLLLVPGAGGDPELPRLPHASEPAGTAVAVAVAALPWPDKPAVMVIGIQVISVEPSVSVVTVDTVSVDAPLDVAM